MPLSEIPCLSLAIAPLKTTGHFAIQVTKAPYSGGYVLNDCTWSEGLTQRWIAWQEMFSTRSLPNVPHISQVNTPLPEPAPIDAAAPTPGQPMSLAGRLMQNLGISLWQWLFDGPIQGSFNRSQGMAMGQGKPLRLRLEIRDPDMIGLPWEIMQDGAGRQAISLSQQLLFSRTTSDVDTLLPLRVDHTLKILLVLGQDSEPVSGAANAANRASAANLPALKLEEEAEALAKVLKTASNVGGNGTTSPSCWVDTLVQPTPEELIRRLETNTYNVFFYAGHGVPAPDGGLLFLRPDRTLNGTELAQVLTRCQVKLAVFNACWGAQPDHFDLNVGLPATVPEVKPSQAIPRSSLAEVLIHHGVPAVLGMRDSITDEEALSFVQALAQALAERQPIDQAVAVARQHLLTLYKFNHQAWTLPVLYMHPEFDGELLKPLEGNLTQLPGLNTQLSQTPMASLRSLNTAKVWQIRGGVMRIGREKPENDLVLPEDQGGSRKHAVIFCRHVQRNGQLEPTFFLEDFSSYGTWVYGPDGWQKIHRQEVPLRSGAQLKFGSSHSEALEFIIHNATH